jgi:3-oxoacyl-(acyl-carrier-protein) synthase
VSGEVFVCGTGAITPAGWGVGALREALARGEPLPPGELPRPGRASPLLIRRVPVPSPKPAFMSNPRLRRASPISQYAVGAAMEALGAAAGSAESGLGLIFCVMTGCVNYSRRFYDEVLKNPGSASPLIFPETVLNAPASHLAALLGIKDASYTLVGDPGTYLQGMALAADWLLEERVQGCLVVAAEELDWLVTEGITLFSRKTIVSEGAGAVYLRVEPRGARAVKLARISSPHLFGDQNGRLAAAQRARAEMVNGSAHGLLCDSRQGVPALDRVETIVWNEWPGERISPKAICGEALAAVSAWQCVAAVDALERGAYDSATVSVVGCNQQAIAAQFVKASNQP